MFSHHIPDSSVSVTGHNISVIPKFFSNAYKHTSSNVTQENAALDIKIASGLTTSVGIILTLGK